MNEILIKIKEFGIQLIESIESLIKFILNFSFNTKTPKVKSDTCVILGNGPSLNASIEHHLAFIKENEMFCVNMFANSNLFQTLKPQNYLLLDEAFLNPNHKLASIAVQNIVKNTIWPMNLFLTNKFKKSTDFISKIESNKNIRVYYFNYLIFEGFDKLKFWFFSKNLAMPQCQNVLVALIFKSINLGFKNILIFGADHTWHETLRLDENNKLILNDIHFYGSNKIEINDQFETHKSYMAAQFLSLHKAFKGYEVLAKYAKYKGTIIKNASERSYIDVFDKIKL